MSVSVGRGKFIFRTVLHYGTDNFFQIGIVRIGKEHCFGIETNGFQVFFHDNFTKFQGVLVFFYYIVFIILYAGGGNNSLKLQTITVYYFINVERWFFILDKNAIFLKFLKTISDQAITLHSGNFLLVFISRIHNMQKRKRIVPKP